MSFAVLLVYEYVITFEEEVSLAWRKRPTATSILLLTTRWAMVAYCAIGLSPSNSKAG